jgi:hypothetical protein
VRFALAGFLIGNVTHNARDMLTASPLELARRVKVQEEGERLKGKS